MRREFIVCGIFSLLAWNIVTASTPVCGGKPADVVFVLDASTSIWGPHYAEQLSFVQNVVDEFDVRPTRTRCGLITFSDYVRVEFNLETFNNKMHMKHAIGRTAQLLGGTRTDLALARMREMYEAEERRGVPKLAIVLTDGESLYTDLTAMEAKLAHETGITVFAVGIGNGVDKKELQKIASSDDLIFEVDSFEALSSIRKLLAIKACELEHGEQADQVVATPPTKGCDGKPADVVFALDASASIWEIDFDKQLNFVKDVVSIFEISPNLTRVGVLTFGDEADEQFHLHKYTDEHNLVAAISQIKQSRGNTNTADAIRIIRKQFFAPLRVRDGVVRIAVIITDGRSDDPVETAQQAKLIREDGVHVFAIGVGHNVDQRELFNIASEPAGQYVFEVNTYDALGSVKHLLAMKTCEVTEPPTTPKPTTTTTTTTPPTTTTTTSTTTTTVPPPTGCSAKLPADIVFAMPPEVSTLDTDQMLKLIRNVTSNLDLDSSAVRFGLIPKHCYSVPGLSLKNGGTNKDDVISKISSTVSKQVDSNELVKHICDVSFHEVQGARSISQKVGVLFVDTSRGPENLLRLLEDLPFAQKRGVHLIIVGVGNGVTQDEINELVGPELGKNILISPDYRELRNVANSMIRRIDELCIESRFDVVRH